VPSWGKLLDDTYANSIFSDSFMADLGKLIKETRPELLDEWSTIADLTIQKAHSMKILFNKNLSDDESHPNRYGHRILRDFLAPEYSHKF
jgi:hypothetical protein